MKKLLVIIMMILIPCVGGALTMCVRDSSLVVSLDQSIAGTSSGKNVSEMLWWVEFLYGRIYGEATCLSAAEGGKPDGSQFAITNSNGEMLSQNIPAGLKGKDADGNDRIHCWCRMTHPAYSRWVFVHSGSVSTCMANCALNCSERVQSYAACRSGLFGSVGK